MVLFSPLCPVLSSTPRPPLTQLQGVTKRAGRKKGAGKESDFASAGPSGKGKSSGVRKAVFESTKKKEVGVSDLTLISKITNEAINENLKKRFENKEIYVCLSRRKEDQGRGC